ncbi:MAG: HAMP domain-containing protein [Gammaproteobacteria bacterium]|nr:HAMP domain-containing protein [Gammaproteobacteria bacterium]
MISFFLITCISTVATTTFAIYYFSGKIESEALQNMRKHIEVADLIYGHEISAVQNNSEGLANDGTLRVLTNFALGTKLSRYLDKFIHREQVSWIIVVNPEREVIGEARAANLIGKERPADLINNALLNKVFSGAESASATELIKTANTGMVALASASRIVKSKAVQGGSSREKEGPQVIGAVLVRYVLNSDSGLVEQIHKLLGVSTAVYLNGKAISFRPSAPEPEIKDAVYRLLLEQTPNYEEADMHRGKQLAEYKTLRDIDENPVAVLGISVPADKYIDTVDQAIMSLLEIMFICILGASALAWFLARSILIPIHKLLDGVKRITSGELSYEILVDLKDELGILALSFNNMAKQLQGSFNTLEQRVENATKKLQNTLAHLAAIIDNMADGLLVTDTEGKIIRFNPALSAMFPSQKKILTGNCKNVFCDEIAKLVTAAEHIIGEAHTAEIALENERIGQAAATAIIHKDTFDNATNTYQGSVYIGSVILIRDITKEKENDRILKDTIQTLTRIGTALSAETDLNKLLEMFVSEARHASNADGGTLYTLENEQLGFKVVQNKSMNIYMGGMSGQPVSLDPISLKDESKISAYSAVHKKIIHEPDVYASRDFDFSGTKEYDNTAGYKTNTMLAVPLLDRMNNCVGVLQLINPLDPKTGAPARFANNQVEIIYSLASQAAVAVENARNYKKIERKNIAFERFVPTDFLQHLHRLEIEDVKLGDASQEHMSILFSDIRSFATLSEAMSAKENFLFLNNYLDRIGPSITGNHGFIDKYIGDAIMALFAGRKHNAAHDAVTAAVGMMTKLREFNAARRNLAPIATGIGIHTGALTLGIIGFKARMESTVIGDAVNLASRVEGLTKQYGISIGITESTLRGLQKTKESFLIREVDTVQVKGKTEPVTIYEVFNGDPESVREEKIHTLDRYNEALHAYKQGRWENALSLFCEVQTKLNRDKVVGIYVNRCREFQETPPPEESWTGITCLSKK